MPDGQARQALAAIATFAYCPLAQYAQRPMPGRGVIDPRGHSKHADEPLDENLPAGHCRHVDCPTTSWYQPSSQGAQEPFVSESAKVGANRAVIAPSSPEYRRLANRACFARCLALCQEERNYEVIQLLSADMGGSEFICFNK